MADIALTGCMTKPLSSFLKALGIFRLVCEQKDRSCHAYWQDGKFILRTGLSNEELCHFFAEEYCPTPLVSPWNGGSGFYPSDNKDGINAVAQSTSPRLTNYRDVIKTIQAWPEFEGLEKKDKSAGEKIKKDCKQIFLQRCRSTLPDCCLDWLDAAYALREDKTAYPPLLGTGGNEGRFEYVNNFMQHVSLIISAKPNIRLNWLKAALQDVASGGFPLSKMAQFDPGSAGGINQGYEAKFEKTRGNPWDYILMMEGTLLFAASLVRRSPDDPLQASAPFTATTNSFAGYASSDLSGNSRGELWLPVWRRPTSLRELKRLFGEGRANLARNQAKSGTDFVMATASLGTDRGIDVFERYSFLERRGQSFVAMPSGSISTEYRPNAAYLKEIWNFLQNILRYTLPASLNSKVHALEKSAFSCAQSPDAAHFQSVSRALAAVDRHPGLPVLKDDKHKAPPLPCRLSTEWLRLCDDGSIEVRLAAALASIYGKKNLGSLRANIAQVNQENPFAWNPSSSSFVPQTGDFYTILSRVLKRRIIDGVRLGTSPFRSKIRLNPADLIPFLNKDIDTELCRDLLQCFSMIASLPATPSNWKNPIYHGKIPYAVALLKLLHTDWNEDMFQGMLTSKLCSDSRLSNLMSAGRFEEACSIAGQHIRTAGGTGIYLPQDSHEMVNGLDPLPITAAMLIPVDMNQLYNQHICH